MGRRRWLFGFLTLVLLWTSAAAAQPARDVVVVGMEAEPPGLDPGQALGLHTLRVTYQIFETLVTTPDDSTNVVPGLAESWQTSPDGLAWTFKLHRGVRFHDGTPLDAQAVKFTFDRVIDPGHPRCWPCSRCRTARSSARQRLRRRLTTSTRCRSAAAGTASSRGTGAAASCSAATTTTGAPKASPRAWSTDRSRRPTVA